MADLLQPPTKIIKLFIAVSIITIIGAVLYYIYYINSITPEDVKLGFHNSLVSSLLNMLSGLILASIAFVGLFLTARSIEANTNSARQQSTIHLVMDINADQRLQDTKNLIFIKESNVTKYYMSLNAEVDFESYKSETVQEDEAKKKARKETLKRERLKDDIHYVLNRYEFIALGIRRGAFDEELFKDLHYSSFMKLWRCTKPLIMEIRSIGGIDTIYQEIELLTCNWEDEPIKKIVKYNGKSSTKDCA